MGGQSTKKRKLAAQPPGHLPERINWKDWPKKSETVNSDIYINECLEKHLLSFIREHQPDSNYIFWPNLADCHYSKQTIAWMDENVKLVPKEINPPNVPRHVRLRTFWDVWHKKFRRKAGRLIRSSGWFFALNLRWKSLIQILWRAF